jgi:hypothetical protein
MSMLDAERLCEGDGSTLVRPQTYFDVSKIFRCGCTFDDTTIILQLHVLYDYIQATLNSSSGYPLQSNVFVWTGFNSEDDNSSSSSISDLFDMFDPASPYQGE